MNKFGKTKQSVLAASLAVLMVSPFAFANTTPATSTAPNIAVSNAPANTIATGANITPNTTTPSYSALATTTGHDSETGNCPVANTMADVMQAELDLINSETSVGEYVKELQTGHGGRFATCLAGIKEMADLSDLVPQVRGLNGTAEAVRQSLKKVGKRMYEQSKERMLDQACDITTNLTLQVTDSIRDKLNILNRLNKAINNPEAVIGGYAIGEMDRVHRRIDKYLEDQGASLSEEIRINNTKLEESLSKEARMLNEISSEAERLSKAYEQALPKTQVVTGVPSTGAGVAAQPQVTAPTTTPAPTTPSTTSSTTTPATSTAPSTATQGSSVANRPNLGAATNQSSLTQSPNTGVIANSSSARPLN